MSPFELNYGFRPASPVAVGIPQRVPSAANYLTQMNKMLELAKVNIRQAMDRAKSYADQNRTPREFVVGDMVFLQVPNSKTLKTGKCYKLSPRYCGPWKIVKRISDVFYKLDFPKTCKVHPVFHVSRLKRVLHNGDNLLSDGLFAFREQGEVTHGPARVLDTRERCLCNRLICEYLVAWHGRPLSDGTWETAHSLRAQYPSFAIADDVT
ncbi:hypothetical protein O6H91_09G098300 [Diphasiastrum complanatum]|uniref:Uncharacterized protein n=1 Tax=Diphasiastrum complanatum TaxID=34168 RepID=A0ACC2CSR4_DIPCM|nr:hypothetical protein O6H91_09G098300 [Diphasiastrum complanatum]